MSKFCRHCGQALSRPGARFCANCGQEQIPQAQGTQRLEGPRLEVQIVGAAPQEEPLLLSTFTIGRLADNDLTLPFPYVSGHHVRLDQVGSGFCLADLGSTNGTFVRGRRIQSPHLLQEGDIIRLGDAQGNSVGLVYRAGMAPDALSGPLPIGQLSLSGKARLLIGRDPSADVPLNHPAVSWRHAELQNNTLRDLGSTNGTFVNGQRLRGSHPLRAGDKIQIGPFVFSYNASGTMSQYSSAQDVRLDGVRLVRRVPHEGGSKVILNDVSVSILPREFIALVGSSGAGKSTLMDALSGFTRATEGQVLLNGDNLYQSYPLYKTMLGYVPQDDIVHVGLPVDRALRYAARLRLPPDSSSIEIERRIDSVLDKVDLLKQKHQIISSLSGGQRKRVSIALEMLAEPSLFFLDEPTSGLDPGLEKKMMYTLRNLADAGRTIVLVTHATANIEQCNHVAFMAYSHLAFFGPPAEARHFFQAPDFADIYSKLADPKEAGDWTQRFQKSPLCKQYVEQRQSALPAAPAATGRPADASQAFNPLAELRQLFILTQRYAELVLRDRMLLFILLAVMPLLGALIDLIAKPAHLTGDPGEAQTMAFLLGLAAALLGIFASAYEIIKEKTIYDRERMVNLRLWSYLLSKVIVLCGFAFIQCLTLLLVVALRVKLPGDGVLLPAPLEMYITLLLATLAGTMLGLWISSLVPNTNSVIYIVLLALFMQIIFAGVLFPLPAISKPLSYLTITRYSTEALGDSANIPELTRRSAPLSLGAMGDEQEDRIDFEHEFDHLALRWFMLLFFAALFGGLTLATQWLKDKPGSLSKTIRGALGGGQQQAPWLPAGGGARRP